MENAKEIAHYLMIRCKQARENPKWLEYRYLLHMGIINPETTPFYRWEEMVSVGSVLRARRKLIEDGVITIDKFAEMNRRRREEQVKKMFARGKK